MRMRRWKLVVFLLDSLVCKIIDKNEDFDYT